MVYDFRVDDATMIKLLEETKKYGGLVQVHAENVYIIQHMNEVLEKEGKLNPITTPSAAPTSPRKRPLPGPPRWWS
jgi:dihydroorotase-like cyclic amidohydrolase